MQSQLFRKKSVERISSPEQLQDYMRVASPGIWMVLAAVIALLAGLLVASALVKVETTVSAKGTLDADGTVIVMELHEGDGALIDEGMIVRAGGRSGRVDYAYQDGDVVKVTASLDDSGDALPAGVYDVQIVTETLSPISFLMN